MVWHGANRNGERDLDAYCDAWHSSSADQVGMASNLHRSRVLGQEQYACNNRFAVLCVEVVTSRRRRRRSIEEEKEMTEEQYTNWLQELELE